MSETRKLSVAVGEDGRVHVLDQSGAPVTVDKADLGQALSAGFTPETPDQVKARGIEKRYGSLVEQAKTFGEGALRGATVGLSDAAGAGILGDEWAENAEARRQANPGTAFAGELTGMVAPALASGGSSAAAEGVAALGAPSRAVSALGRATEGLVGRAVGEGGGVLASAGRAALRTGAGFAAEGAAYGLGQSVTDAALGGTDWTVDHALSDMGEGALYGLGTGALAGGASSLLRSAGKAAVERMTEGKSLREAVSEFAEGRATKSVVGNNQRLYNEITNFGENPENVQRLGRKLLDADVPLTDASAGIRKLDEKATEAAEVRKAIAEQIDKAGVKVDAESVLSRVDEQVEKLKAVGLGSHDAVAARLESEIAPLKKAVEEGKEYGFSDWWKLRQKFDETLNWAKRGGDPATDNLRELRKTLDSGLDDALLRHADEQGKLLSAGSPKEQAQAQKLIHEDLNGRWKQSGRDYGDWVTLREAAEQQSLRAEKNRFISPSDYGFGATASVLGAIAHGTVGGLLGVVTGGAASMAHKLVRERGSGVIARVADAAAKMDVETSRAAQVIAGTLKSAGRAPVEATIRAAQERSRDEDFRSALGHVQRFESDPQYAEQQTRELVRRVAPEQPELAQAMAAKYRGDMQYLAAKAPRSTVQGGKSLTPKAIKASFTSADQRKFLKITRALAAPRSVIRDLRHGELDRDAVEALKARRPEVWESLRTKVALECGKRDDELPYKKRVFLSLAFDFSGDPSLEPQTMAAIQQSLQQAPAGGEQGGAPPSPSGVKVDGAELSASFETPSQKAANG